MAVVKIRKYSIEDTEKALDTVRRGVSVASASKESGIPRITLLYKSKGKYLVKVRMGPEMILTLEEEELLVKPWRKWCKGFMARHPEISETLTQNLTKCRSDLTGGKICHWFQEINDYLTANHLQAVVKDPRRIYNADETLPLWHNEIPRPVLFFVDGHASHLTIDLSNFCSENQIILVALYPNATHVLQPMDVAVFHPLKDDWKTTCGLFSFDPNAINYAKYFKDKKNKSGVVNTKPNLEFKVKNEFLEYLEAKLGNEKLNNFMHEEEAGEWNGEIKDTNLFML
ncbi:hypothetical protein ILUMI_02559 [Ignelater luminosus]|uniref:DDE-1 domain-containing protein n=1 Tax=Ignelater luminosus TaxID=2038154 RepID=A0A8K0GJ62_IGNLU|nr:hypothetical protein ILUMI_02559 [Ignelater luminosus]